MTTSTEAEIARLEAELAELRDRQAREEAAKASTTPPIRALAVQLHSLLCQDSHEDLVCNWFAEGPDANDPELAAWSAPAHAAWLDRARGGVGVMLQTGWVVTPPGQSEPLPVPSSFP